MHRKTLGPVGILLILFCAVAVVAGGNTGKREPVFLIPTDDEAVVYVIKEDVMRWQQPHKVFVDDRPLGSLTRKSYLAVKVDAGWHLLWGTCKSEWFDFKAGRSYTVRIDPNNDRWALDGPQVFKPMITEWRLRHIDPSDEDLDGLRSKLGKYEKVRAKAGDPPGPDALQQISDLVVKDNISGLRSNPSAYEKKGTLTITDTALSFRSKKRELDIPIGDLLRVDLAGPQQHWLAVTYGNPQDPRTEFVTSRNPSASLSFVSMVIQNAMRPELRSGELPTD